jgi:hypothetical protein
MRFFEFKQPLLEYTLEKDISTSTMMFDLQSIANIAEEIPPENQAITNKILANLQGTESKITQQLAKLGIELPDAGIDVTPEPVATPQEPVAQQAQQAEPQPAQQAQSDEVNRVAQLAGVPQIAQTPTPQDSDEQEDEPEEEKLAEAKTQDPSVTSGEIKALAERLMSHIDFILKLPITKTFSHAQKMSMVADIEHSIKINKALIKQVKTLTGKLKASEAEKEIAKNFLKEVNSLLEALGNKVQEFKETSVEEKQALNSKERSQVLSKEKNARAFTQNLKHFMFGLIIDITLKPEIHQTNETEIKEFLQACVAGKVINMLSLIAETNGNVESHVNEEFMKLFNIFKTQKIFSYNPGKTSGAIGPGEMALSMMGNPAQKAKKGDLLIGDKEIEVKAGSTSGGRLNSKKITKPAAAWKKAWTPGIQKIVSHIPKGTPIRIKDQETGQVVAVTKDNFSPNIINYKKEVSDTGEKIKGAGKEGARYNFNETGLTALNNDILRPFSTRELTVELFWETFRRIILNLEQVEESLGRTALELIDSAIPQTEDGRDGGIDVDAMIKAYTLLAYESYHLADGITTIMYLNTESLDYALVENGNDLIDRLGQDIKVTGGFNFNDDQQTPTPAYLVMTQAQAAKAQRV